MQQLTLHDLSIMIDKILREGINLDAVPIYIGNDEELTGIHNAHFMQQIEGDKFILDMIENADEYGILIS